MIADSVINSFQQISITVLRFNHFVGAGVLHHLPLSRIDLYFIYVLVRFIEVASEISYIQLWSNKNYIVCTKVKTTFSC